MIDLPDTGTLYAKTNGNIYIYEINGNLNLDFASSTNGDVYLKANNSIIGCAENGADVAAGNVVLEAINGVIGSSSDYFNIDTRTAGNLTATARNNIYIHELTADLKLNNVTSQSGIVYLIAAGSMSNAGADGISITADKAILQAGNNIGAADSLLRTALNYLEGTAQTGGFWLKNNKNLNIGNVDDSTGISAKGNIELVSAGTLTIMEAVNANTGGIKLMADNSGAGHNVVINPGITVQSQGSSLTVGGEEVILLNGALLKADGPVSLAARGNFTANKNVQVQSVTDTLTISGKDILLQNGSLLRAAKAISLAARDNMTAVTGAEIKSETATVTIASGDNMVIQSGAKINAPDIITLSIDDDDTDDGVGARLELYGIISSPHLTILGAQDDDTVLIDMSTSLPDTEIKTGSGNDEIILNLLKTISGTYAGHQASVNLDGQGGSDRYIINLSGTSNYLINVNDTGAAAPARDETIEDMDEYLQETAGADYDYLTLNGTAAADNISIRKYFIALINYESDSNNDGACDIERLNYNESIENIYINTLGGDDRIVADDTSTFISIDGGEGNDFFQVAQVFKSPRDANANVAAGDEIETVETTRGFLTPGTSKHMAIYGGVGNDQFQIYHNRAVLNLYGEDGDDKFVVRAFVILDDKSKQAMNNLAGGNGVDEINYAINAPLNIDGGAGEDIMTVICTEFPDQMVITADGVYGAGLNISYVNIEILEVDGMEGDDTFYILSTPFGVTVRLIGNLGSDTFIIAGEIVGTVVSKDAAGNQVIFPDALMIRD
jgi:hypothetical protein